MVEPSSGARKISVLGSINVDLTFYVDDLPRPGETLLSKARHQGPGGKGANQAVAIAAQGIAVELLARVGDDAVGHQTIRELGATGVDVSAVLALPGYSTGMAMILVSDSGENEIIVDPAANEGLSISAVAQWLKGREKNVLLAQLEVPHVSVVTAAASHQGTFILNPAPIKSVTAEILELLKYADVLVPNKHELAALSGVEEPNSVDDVIHAVRSLPFSGQVVVTLGAGGAIVFPEGPQGLYVKVPAPKVRAVDTSGAGDAFCAGLTVALAHDSGLIAAAKHAIGLASWSVTQKGAQVNSIPPEHLYRKLP